jgi:hypothetical protein
VGEPGLDAALPPAEPHEATASALAPTVTNVLMRISPGFLSLRLRD